MLWISGIKKNLFQRWRWKIWYFWAKKLMEIYLLITEKFFFWPFREWEIRSLFEPKSWWKDDIYWLLKSSCFDLFGNGKYGLFLRQKVDGKMIFTDYWKVVFLQLFGDGKYGHFLSPEVDGKIIFTGYWEVLVLNFLVMGNTVFFSAKMKMERRYLLGLFALSMIFQDLRNMVFRAVFESSYFIGSSNQNSKTELYGLLVWPCIMYLISR